MVIHRPSWQNAKGKIVLHIEQRTKRQFSVAYISVPKGRDKRRYKIDLKHWAVARNCIYGFSVVGVWIISVFVFNLIVSGKIAIIAALNVFSLFWFLKEKLASRIFHMAAKNFGLCFAVKEKFYWHFLATTFFHMATEKKTSVASWRLPKKVNFRPWLVVSHVICMRW